MDYPVHHVLISIGTNHQRMASLTLGMEMLRTAFQIEAVSHCYVSPSVGAAAAPYWNGMVKVLASVERDVIKQQLRHIEDAAGRIRVDAAGAKSRIVTLDLDLVAVDGLAITDELFDMAHCVVPLADIAPDWTDVRSGKSAGWVAAAIMDSIMRLPNNLLTPRKVT